jgi:PAS domain S-box-containing protein
MLDTLDAIFKVVAPGTYWVIVAIWAVILVIFVRKVRRSLPFDDAFRVLLIVLALDAFRTLFENLYFGIYFNAYYGFISESFQKLLGTPTFLAIPKLVNIVTGVLVLFLLIRHWLPNAERERAALADDLARSLAETRALNERYRRTIDASPDLICVLDEQGRFVDAGARSQTLLGWAPSALIGTRLIELLPEAQREAAGHCLSKAGAEGRDGRTEELDCHVRTFDARELRMRWTFAASSDGRLVYAVGRDESERAALEEQLQKSRRLEAVGQLTGGLAHDFNNLLTVVIGALDELRLGGHDDARRRLLIDIGIKAGERGAELTRRMLAFARRQPLAPRPIDLGQLIGEVRPLVEKAIDSRIRLRIDIDSDLPRVLADPGQLENAVLNLCLNARDAMPEGGVLALEARPWQIEPGAERIDPELAAGRYVQISVIDTGRGMDADTLAHAFDPFFTTKTVGKGSGLGLSMVYGFARQSKGGVSLVSAPGQGTTVRLWLPVATEGAAERQDERETAMPEPGGTEQLLVVEDDAIVREHVGGLLHSLGYRVELVPDADAALASLAQANGKYDLVFTDMVMPGSLDGLQLVLEIRRLYPTMPVLLTSGYTEHALDRREFREAGIPFLAKPYRRPELARALRRALG